MNVNEAMNSDRRGGVRGSKTDIDRADDDKDASAIVQYSRRSHEGLEINGEKETYSRYETNALMTLSAQTRS